MGEEFLPYTDRYGLIHTKPVGPDRDPSSLNGNLYTSEAYILAYLAVKSHGYDHPPVVESIREQWSTAVQWNQLLPGLYLRSPLSHDQNAWDDYLGLACASSLLDAGATARAILYYGRETGGVWNNVEPGKMTPESWFGRSPVFLVHLQLCAGEDPGVWGNLVWGVGLWWSTRTDAQDSWIQSWLMVQAVKNLQHSSVIRSLAMWIWWKRLHAKWGSMRTVVAAYLGDPLGTHPFVKHWDEYQ